MCRFNYICNKDFAPSETQEIPKAILDTNTVTFNLPSPDLPIPKKVQFSLTLLSVESSTNEDDITSLNEKQRINDPIVKGAIALMGLEISGIETGVPIISDPDLLPTAVDLAFNQDELGHILEDFDFWIRVNKQIERKRSRVYTQTLIHLLDITDKMEEYMKNVKIE